MNGVVSSRLYRRLGGNDVLPGSSVPRSVRRYFHSGV